MVRKLSIITAKLVNSLKVIQWNQKLLTFPGACDSFENHQFLLISVILFKLIKSLLSTWFYWKLPSFDGFYNLMRNFKVLIKLVIQLKCVRIFWCLIDWLVNLVKHFIDILTTFNDGYSIWMRRYFRLIWVMFNDIFLSNIFLIYF